MGSVYRSQNVDSWTENLKEDIKFQLNRAEFDISRTASVMLTNDNIGYETMDDNSIRTSAEASSSATLERFRGNNKYIEVTHRDHGFEDSGKSFAFFKNLEETGGISASSLNTTLFTVENSGVDTFNIVSTTNASSNAIGGGSKGLISLNKKYEKLYADIGYLSFPQTKIESSVKTTNIIPVDSGPINYVSYAQSDYEKTFIKQEHYFINQKVLASRINALRNDIANSLVYKLDLSSTQSTLSPVIDLRTSSVKTISNRIENPTGGEDRYGRRNQIIKLYPIVQFAITGHSGAAITVPQSINSTTVLSTSEVKDLAGGAGTIIAWDAGTSTMTVKLTNEGQFKAREILTFGTDTALNKDPNDASDLGTTITDAGSQVQSPTFTVGTTVNGYNETQSTTSDTSDDLYLDKISGIVVEWDSKTQELVLFNNKQPINNDFTSKITALSPFSRKEDPTDQSSDIFRVGDLLQYVGQSTNTEDWWEIKSASLQNGVGYVSEDSSKNTSGIAKYVTKEISLDNPGTSIDVKLTANVRNINDIKILYKIKEESSEVNFDDIEWKFFNVNGNADIELAATAENEISGLFEKQDAYQEIPFSSSNLPEFTSFAVKVVMNSDNPAYVPKLQDIRAVASF